MSIFDEFKEFARNHEVLPADANRKCKVCGGDADHAHQANSALFITCFCGLARLLPDSLVYGETFWLPPCPACGAGFKGIYRGNDVDFVL